VSSQGTSSKFFLLLRDPYPHTSLLLRVTSTHPSLPPSLPPSLQVRCSSVGHFPLTSSKQGFLVTQYLGEGTDVFEGEEGGRGGGREGGREGGAVHTPSSSYLVQARLFGVAVLGRGER